MKAEEKQKYQKMHFRAYDGTEMEEYIPGEVNKYKSWVLVKYGILRSKLGLKVYYWHIRHNHSPHDRKRLDLDFVQHVVMDHNSNPDDPIEKRHFKKAWDLYGFEVNYVLDEFKKSKNKDGEYKLPPEIDVYTKKWYSIYPEPERKFMYHGVKYYEMANYFEQSIEEETIRLKAYFVEHGLDPDTGKKAKQSSDD